MAEVAAWRSGLCTGTLGKIARDMALLAQTEVDEVREPASEGRGSSSTHAAEAEPGRRDGRSRRPRSAMPGLVATVLAAMVQEHERAAGGWQAEWETVPDLICVFAGALHHLTDAVVGLEVDAARMRANLDASDGLVFAEAVHMALAPRLGRAEAARVVASACARARSESRHLRDVLAGETAPGPRLSADELDSLFEARNVVSAAAALVDRVLASHARMNAQEG